MNLIFGSKYLLCARYYFSNCDSISDIGEMKMKKICIAVDGTAGSGKTFIFNQIANILDYNLFDTGQLYRAFTYYLHLVKTNFDDQNAIIEGLTNFNFNIRNKRVFINNDLDVTDSLNGSAVTDNINQVTIIPQVRDYMTKIEREIGYQEGMIELGRDITSVVLPDADLKIYLDSPLQVRAQRRYEQNMNEGIDESYQEVLEKITARDTNDKTRSIGPLVQTKDAWYLDSSQYERVEDLVDVIVKRVRELEKEKK